MSEAWAEAGDPSPPARLAGARALIDLRQLDRAWVRLKDLVDRDPPNVKGVALAAQMFILRGWPNQARKVLQRGMEIRPDDDHLQELWDQAAEGPTEPEWVDEEAASPGELVRQAEQYLARGSLVRAQGLLERVRRAEPEHARAGDLLWGLEGDYAARDGRSLSQLVAKHGLGGPTFGDLEADAEHTESANLADLPLQLERDEDVRFPSLFRNLSAPPLDPDGGEPEVTAVTSMADLADIASSDSETTGPAGDDHDPDGRSYDTQIMRVVHKQSPSSLGGEAAHIGAPRIDRSFDLAEFRREFGMTHGATLDTDYTEGPEDEDDSVIILTRREEESQEAVDTTDAGDEEGPLTLDTSAEAEASKLKGAIEDDVWAKPQRPRKRKRPDDDKAAPRAARPAPSNASSTPEHPTQRPSLAASAPPPRALPPPPLTPLGSPPEYLQVGTWPWWVALLGAILAMGVVAFAFIALVAALQ